MTHELTPRCGELPPAIEIARLLENEFAYVKVDTETGLQAALAQAAWIERAPASIFLGHQQRALETAAELKALKLGEALAIEFGDDSDRTLRCVVIPGESIKFGYGSNEEEAEAAPLVERCARALGCDIDVV